jgi:hypothetical protein
MLIVFAGITILSATTFIIQRLLLNEANRVRTRCIYLAQAGIHNAIYWYRFNALSTNGYFSLGPTAIDSANSFVLGATAGDLLMVNNANSSLGPLSGPPPKRFSSLSGLTMQNAADTDTVTIERMIVTWDNTRDLQEIWIDSSMVWQGREQSPANCDITDFTLDAAASIYDIDSLKFDRDMSAATVNLGFVMSDGTSKNLTVYQAGQVLGDYCFRVKATGKTTGSNIYRSIQAEYNALSAKITDYREIDEEIAP